jgi:hypothetical protein
MKCLFRFSVIQPWSLSYTYTYLLVFMLSSATAVLATASIIYYLGLFEFIIEDDWNWNATIRSLTVFLRGKDDTDTESDDDGGMGMTISIMTAMAILVGSSSCSKVLRRGFFHGIWKQPQSYDSEAGEVKYEVEVLALGGLQLKVSKRSRRRGNRKLCELGEDSSFGFGPWITAKTTFIRSERIEDAVNIECISLVDVQNRVYLRILPVDVEHNNKNKNRHQSGDSQRNEESSPTIIVGRTSPLLANEKHDTHKQKHNIKYDLVPIFPSSVKLSFEESERLWHGLNQSFR